MSFTPDSHKEQENNIYRDFLDYAVLGDYVQAQECIKHMWDWNEELAMKMEDQLSNLNVHYLTNKAPLYV